MTAPSLNDLRADARMVCDFKGRKVGIYPNASGQVVILSEEDGRRSYTVLEPGEVALACALLMRAEGEGTQIHDYLESQYQTYLAIEHAKGAD